MIERRGKRRVLDHPENVGRPFPFVERGEASDPDGGTDPAAEAIARAREDGIREGLRRASAELETEVEEFRSKMAATLKQIAELEETLRHRHEATLLDVALEAASRLVRERIDSGDPVAARALREALDELPATMTLKARLHPEDLETTSRELASEIESGRIELCPDPSVGRGGCIVETAAGTVDATLETAWDSVRNTAHGTEEVS